MSTTAFMLCTIPALWAMIRVAYRTEAILQQVCGHRCHMMNMSTTAFMLCTIPALWAMIRVAYRTEAILQQVCEHRCY